MNFKKPNLAPAVGMALALSLCFTSCIDNSESDGVLAVRQAQAELIKAKATAETTIAIAEAAYQNALAEVKLAEAEQQKAETAYQLLVNEAKALANSLQSANDEAEKQLIEAKLEVNLAEQKRALADAENAIEVANYVNEANLASAKQDLAEALKDIEERVASEAVDNPVLDTYVAKYTALLTEINTLQNSIVSQTATIAKHKLYATGSYGSGVKLVSEVTKLKAEYASDKAEYEAIVVRYKAVLADLSTVDAEVVAAQDEIASLKAEIAKTEVSLEAKEAEVKIAAQAKSDARFAYDGYYYTIGSNGQTSSLNFNSSDETNAKFLMDQALDAYNDALQLEAVIDGLEENDAYSYYVDDKVFTELNYELDKSDIIAANGGSQNFRETDYYQDIIDNSTVASEVSDADAVIKFVKAVIAQLKEDVGGATPKAGVEALMDAYFAAKKVYLAAGVAFDNTDDAYDVVVDEYNTINDSKTAYESSITNLKSFISTIENGTEDDINVAISNAEDDVISIDNQLNELDVDITEWSSLVAVEETQLAIDVAKKEAKEKEADEVEVLLNAELDQAE